MIKRSPETSIKDFSFNDFWSCFVVFLTGVTLLSVGIGCLGLFYWFTELALIVAMFRLSGLFSCLVEIFKNQDFLRPTFFNISIAALLLVWFVALIFFAPFPAFSGRDEGSYSNAAVYLAKNAGFFVQPTLLQYFNEEGSAHKALSYPGFVIKDSKLLTQFSPGYSTFLAVFFVFFGVVGSFIWANGLLIIGGSVAFYILIRNFIPKWAAFLALLMLLFNFTVIWFSRFTLSENLAFFINLNILLFSFLVFNGGKKRDFIALILLALLAPLVRPEGFWVFICAVSIGFLALRKSPIKSEKGFFLKTVFLVLGGATILAYSLFFQWPVYLQLFKDFIKWPINKGSLLTLSEDGKAGFGWSKIISILDNILPDFDKLYYFMLMEAKYGVLIFALILIFVLTHFLLKKSGNFYDIKDKIFFGQVAIFSAPYLMVLLAPQISQDHPWFLRRFLPLILPFGVLAGSVFIYKIANQYFRKKKYLIYLGSVLLLFFFSFPASAYFFALKTDEGRAEALEQSAGFIARQENPIVFLQRESSGDGWKMFSLPLNSVYNIEAVYVYNPKQILEMKKLIAERFSKGEKSFIILPSNAYSFEHDLKKGFNLILEKQIDYNNLSLEIDPKKRETDWPTLEKTKNSVKIYSLNLKYE